MQDCSLVGCLLEVADRIVVPKIGLNFFGLGKMTPLRQKGNGGSGAAVDVEDVTFDAATIRVAYKTIQACGYAASMAEELHRL